MKENTKKTVIRDRFALKLLLSEKVGLSEEEVEYFHQHPEDIDEITAPENPESDHTIVYAMNRRYGQER